MHADTSITIAFILMVGMLAQWASWRLRQPSILLLLLIGIVAGPVANLFNPDELFGDLLFPMISFGVALVLFEGALTLKFRDLRGHGKAVFSLVTWGALLNWILISAGTWLLLDLSWSLCILFGALVVVTGPTVIMPLLKSVKPNNNVANILRWEGILIDPLGALLAVLIFEVIIAGGSDHFWAFLGREIGCGTLLGLAGGAFLGVLLRFHWLPEYLHNVFTLALVLTVFSVSNHFAEESGLLAVTVMGIWLANVREVDIEEILSFKESLSLLIISTLFIVLAARIDLGLIMGLGWAAAGIIVVVFVARVIMIHASTMGADLKWQERALLSWIAPRGIVAAAVSALFAFRLEDLGYENASLLPAMTFLVIIVTVLLQSLTSAKFAKWLKVQSVNSGVLIVGGNPVAIALGKSLKENGFRVKVASANWSEAQAARMAGLESYFGSPVSAHAEMNLDLLGFGKLFAMSRRPALNALSAVKYEREFGRSGVFTLRTAEEQDASEKSRISEKLRVPRLFGSEISIQKLSSLIGKGYTVKTTRLTEEFDFDAFEEHYGNVVKLCAVDPNGKLKPYTDGESPKPGEGWRILFLSPEKENKVKESDSKGPT